MKLSPYPRYKPSGIEWLGDVPEHWQVSPIVRQASAIQTGPFGSQLHEGDYVEGGIPLINPAHIAGDRVVPDGRSSVDEETAQRLRRHRLLVGDVILARRGEIGRCALVTADEEGWLAGTGALVLRLANCNPRYAVRVLSSSGFSKLLELRAVGTTMLNLNPAIVGRMLLPVPPEGEQCAISDFLDRETAKIDMLAAKKRTLIERLKEKRAALISRSVTRGLPPDAAVKAGLDPHPNLKASGIEWLGDVPEHWDIKKLSWLFRYAKGPSAALLTKEYVAENQGEFPVFSGQTENDGLMGSIDWCEFDLAKPAIFVTTVGARAMSTRLVSGEFSLSQNCALIIPRNAKANAEYYEAVLRGLFDYERRSISLIMQPSLRFDDLDKFRVPLPPSNEQVAIVRFLSKETTKIDAMVAKVETAIERLLEYRTALITAAVTGKIDVRGVVHEKAVAAEPDSARMQA